MRQLKIMAAVIMAMALPRALQAGYVQTYKVVYDTTTETSEFFMVDTLHVGTSTSSWSTTINASSITTNALNIGTLTVDTYNPANVTATYGVSAATGVYSGALAAASIGVTYGVTAATGVFSGALSADSLAVGDLSVTYGVSAATGVFSGAITAATLDTGQGANELYDMDQNVLTTSDVTFNSVAGDGSALTGIVYYSSAPLSYDSLAITYGITGGSLTIDTNTLKVDAVNNRVGIGTASPTSKLDITTSDYNLIDLHRTGANAAYSRIGLLGGKFILTTGDTVTDYQIAITTSSAAGGKIIMNDNSKDCDFIVESDNSANALFVQGSDGKVGIGTASPVGELDVASTGVSDIYQKRVDSTIGDADVLTRIHFSGTDGGTEAAPLVGAMIEVLAAQDWSAGNSGSDFQIKTTPIGSATPATRMTILDGGNVGIGTASPLETLQVNGETVLKTDELFSLTSGLITTAGNVFDSLQVVASSTTSGIGGIGASIAFASTGTSPRRGAVIASVQGTTDVDQMGLAFYTHPTTLVGDPIVLQFRIAYDGGLHVANLKTAVDQATAGAVAGEIWADSDDGYALKLGQ